MSTCRACPYSNNCPRRSLFNTDGECRARAKEVELKEQLKQTRKELEKMVDICDREHGCWCNNCLAEIIYTMKEARKFLEKGETK